MSVKTTRIMANFLTVNIVCYKIYRKGNLVIWLQGSLHEHYWVQMVATIVCLRLLCNCNFFHQFWYNFHTTKNYIILKPVKCQR